MGFGRRRGVRRDDFSGVVVVVIGSRSRVVGLCGRGSVC